jgi:ribose transport system permease protein
MTNLLRRPQTAGGAGDVPAAAAPGQRFHWRDYTVYIAFAVLFVIFAITLSDDGFLSSNNLTNIIAQTAPISIMAIAVTFVIAAAQIDLSVGSVAGLTSVTTAMAIEAWGGIPGVIVGVLTGCAIGVINGTLVAYVGIPSFLVTLGMLGIAAGLAMWITSSAPKPILDQTYNDVFGSAEIAGVPILVLWTLVAVVIGHVILRKRPFGRYVLATGGNEEAARFSGIPTKRIVFTVMVASAIVAGIAGMLYAGRLQSGRFSWGQGDELSVIAAVVLGGTSLFGGRGTVIGALAGSLLIGMINNGMLILGLEYSQQQIVRGTIIILAVAVAGRD